MKKLPRKFYTRSTLRVAKELLGNYLIVKIGRKKLTGKIVETEAYVGPNDKASHAYLPPRLRKFPGEGKITCRNKTEYLEGGHIYIYLCYGMYWQFNITTAKEGKPECVLIRALEPSIKQKKQDANTQKLANGPGKLCRWMRLDKSFDGEDLTKSKRIWVAQELKIKRGQIAAAKRIGIDYAKEWAKKPWRFYIKNNPFISKK